MKKMIICYKKCTKRGFTGHHLMLANGVLAVIYLVLELCVGQFPVGSLFLGCIVLYSYDILREQKKTFLIRIKSLRINNSWFRSSMDYMRHVEKRFDAHFKYMADLNKQIIEINLDASTHERP